MMKFVNNTIVIISSNKHYNETYSFIFFLVETSNYIFDLHYALDPKCKIQFNICVSLLNWCWSKANKTSNKSDAKVYEVTKPVK